MAGIVDQVCDALALHILKGQNGHLGIPGAPGVLSQTDLAVFLQFPAVDAHIAVGLADAH